MRPKKTILCVDDNEQTLSVRKFLLETRGYRVYTATNGNDAITVFSSTSIDLVLTDLAVSRRHAEVRADGGAVRVATLPGVAPLLLDGQATERATLARGARLLIGQTWLRVESADSGGERVGSASDFSRGKGPIGARVCPNPTYAHSAFHSRRKPRT